MIPDFPMAQVTAGVNVDSCHSEILPLRVLPSALSVVSVPAG
jgi:hypothetical protein